jgi:aminoglycoside 6'-N-acetyltransferase I
MTHSIHPLAAITDADEAAACILFRTFTELGKGAWPDLDSARREVAECLESPNLCLGIFDHANDQRLCGWLGLRPMYEHT